MTNTLTGSAEADPFYPTDAELDGARVTLAAVVAQCCRPGELELESGRNRVRLVAISLLRVMLSRPRCAAAVDTASELRRTRALLIACADLEAGEIRDRVTVAELAHPSVAAFLEDVSGEAAR